MSRPAPLSSLVAWCPDCAGAAAGIRRDQRRGRWIITIWHERTCPVLRSARLRRAVDRSLADAIGAVLAVADYAGDEDSDVIGEHLVSRR